MARPRKAEGEGRDVWVSPVRVTMAEKLQIDENAARSGLDYSEFVRRVLLGVRITKPRPANTADRLLSALNDLAFEVSKLGTNVNQIAARLHQTDRLPAHMPELVEEMRGLVVRIRAVIDGIKVDGS